MVEVYRDAKDEWRWRLLADNGEIVADSAEGYKVEADCLHGLRVATKLLVEAAIGGQMTIEATNED